MEDDTEILESYAQALEKSRIMNELYEARIAELSRSCIKFRRALEEISKNSEWTSEGMPYHVRIARTALL